MRVRFLDAREFSEAENKRFSLAKSRNLDETWMRTNNKHAYGVCSGGRIGEVNDTGGQNAGDVKRPQAANAANLFLFGPLYLHRGRYQHIYQFHCLE